MSVSVQVKIGNAEPGAFVEPLRVAPDYSYVKVRALLAGEYEHDVLLDPTRVSRIQPRAVLASGEVMTCEPVYFDRNTTPDIILAYAEDTTVVLVADSDTFSVRAQRIDATGATNGWGLWLDGAGLRVKCANHCRQRYHWLSSADGTGR